MIARSGRLELRGHASGPIGPAGAAALAASPALAKCVTLDLTGNDLGDAGLGAIMGSRHLANLRVLKVGRNQITDAGIVAVRELLPGLFARLRVLDLSENRLTRYGIGILEAARGDRRVALDWNGNVQPSATAPVPIGELVPDALRGVAEVAEAAELKRRIAHPRMRPGDRTNRPS
jgi:hypothetical protein